MFQLAPTPTQVHTGGSKETNFIYFGNEFSLFSDEEDYEEEDEAVEDDEEGDAEGGADGGEGAVLASDAPAANAPGESVA